MIIITSGNKYIDIDAYSSCIAYNILLNSLGEKSQFVSTATLNNTIPKCILDLDYTFQKEYINNNDDKFIIIDLSNYHFIEQFINKNKIIEIIDHHCGFENYWKEQNINTQIENIGSVATIIYEKFIYYNKTNLLDDKLCKLLIAGILDNTLNLKSSNTTDRDIKAYNDLHRIGYISKSFDEQYFYECQQKIEDDIINSLELDLKVESFTHDFPRYIAQLTLYNTDNVIKNITSIKQHFQKTYRNYLINVISLHNGKSYILCNKENQHNLSKLFNSQFDNNILTLQPFMLRKEIIKFAKDKLLKA